MKKSLLNAPDKAEIHSLAVVTTHQSTAMGPNDGASDDVSFDGFIRRDDGATRAVSGKAGARYG
ncbi:MAG: hypothetical protein U0Y68_03560 [Blastocatellia bacterium]